jgi:hypothetical protein
LFDDLRSAHDRSSRRESLIPQCALAGPPTDWPAPLRRAWRRRTPKGPQTRESLPFLRAGTSVPGTPWWNPTDPQNHE